LSPDFDAIWMARGGYGAQRILPLLDELTARGGRPKKKLLIGYSDVTVLHEYVRTRWGWSTLHARMPAESTFAKTDSREWQATLDYVRGSAADAPWALQPLTWMNDPPTKTLHGELIGGNLSLWASLVGTPYAQSGRGKFIFLEDTDEPFYRIDRMMIQCEQAGSFDGALAIILGDFTDCKDESNTCLADAQTGQRKPLRKVYEKAEAFEAIFTQLANRVGVPLASGLPVGHGPSYSPLPLGANYTLSPDGLLRLTDWDWLHN